MKDILRSKFLKGGLAIILIVMVVFGLAPSAFKNNIFAPKKAGADAWWNASWTKRVKITFANGSRGALADFPVLVSLNSGRVTYGDFKAAGADIRFVDADGSTLLNYEIEKWNTSATSTIWLKVPQIDGSSNVDYVYMYYGNTGASATATTTGVWDASYATVQHWAEDPAGSAPQFQDSSSSDKDGTASSSVGSPVVASTTSGKFGQGLDFNGNTQFVDQGNAPLGSLPNGSAEFWFDIDTMAASSSNRYLYSRVKSGANDGELRVYVDTTTGSVNRDKIVFQIECTSPSSASSIATSTASTTIDNWYHVTAVWDDDTANAMKLFVNGAQVSYASTTTCGSEATAVVTNQGRNNALTNGYLDGQMDELRVSTIARSADWINASYTSGIDTLNTYASPENQPDTTAPIISSIASSTSDVTTTITWTTDEAATSTVDYGLTSSYGTASSSNTATTSHSIVLSGLTASTTYNFRISVWDNGSNLATSTNLTFRTTAEVAPGQPSGLTVTPYDTRGYLRWTASTGNVTDYKIEYKLSTDGAYSTFSDGVSTATTTMVSGLANGSAYNFRVTGLNGSTESTPSSVATATPDFLMTFVSPTIANGSTTVSNTVYASASTTSNIPSHFTFRLETSGGALISNATTSVRYGNGLLSHLSELSHKQNLSLTADLSGHAYVPTTDTLFTVHNNQNIITEVTRAGVAVRTITCSACGDIEGITLISSIASSTNPGVFDHIFMISTEDAGKIFKVNIPSTGTITVSDDTEFYNTGIAHAGNDGLEGIAYDGVRDQFYTAIEGDSNPPAKLYKVTLGVAPSVSTSTICTNLDPLSTYVNDISGLDYSTTTQMLYVLSHESDKMYQIDISNTASCGTPTPVGGIAVNMEVGTDVEMAEGISWDATLDYLYISAEADYWSIWRTNTYEVRKTYTGLANGTYNLYTSVTDTYGNTSTTTARAFTVAVPDVTPPVLSNIASSTTTTTATITWDTNENATSTVNFGLTTGYGTASSSSVSTQSHSIVLSGLTASTTYNYQISSWDSSGNLSTSSNRTLRTAIDATAPIISNINVAPSLTGAVITWTTDEHASSSVSHGTTDSYGTVSTSSGATAHSVTLSGLIENTVYHYRMFARDYTGNISTTTDAIFTTTATPVASVVVGPQGGGGIQTPFTPNAPVVILPPQGNQPQFQQLAGGPIGGGVLIKKVQSKGKRGPDVKLIQRLLNADPATQVAKVGPGSPGKETTLYGQATKIAVGKFQLKYGIVKSSRDTGFGVVGPKTKAKMNELLKKN